MKKIIWTKCIDCGRKITDHGKYYDTDKESCYTEIGAGPFCVKCYEKWQKIDDKIKQENQHIDLK